MKIIYNGAKTEQRMSLCTNAWVIYIFRILRAVLVLHLRKDVLELFEVQRGQERKSELISAITSVLGTW